MNEGGREKEREGGGGEKEGKKRERGKRDLQTDFYFHNSIIGQFKGEEGRM